MNIEQLIQEIQSSPVLTDAVKQEWIARITAEGLTEATIDGLQDALQAGLDRKFEEAGGYERGTDDSGAYEKMMTETQAAKEEFDGTMDDLNKQTQTVLVHTLEEIDHAEAQSISDSIKAGE